MRPPMFGLIACVALVASAHATNDTWATRTPIGALPFHAVDPQFISATSEASDPGAPCLPDGAAPLRHSVWFGYTSGASTEYVTVGAHGDVFAALVAVFTGAPGSFRIVGGGCGGAQSDGVQGLRLAPNTEYSFLVGAVNATFTGTLTFDLGESLVYRVTKTADTYDGACDADCSLREAIDAANLARGAVLIPAGVYAVSRPGRENSNATGDFDIACGMGLYGAGMDQTTIDGKGYDAVLEFDYGNRGFCALSLADLTLTGGSTQLGSSGGGLRMAPNGTFPPDFIGMERVRITGNQAQAQGGGAYIICPAVIRDSRIDHNISATYGGGIFYSNYAGPSLDISGTTFDANQAQYYGGGLYMQGGSARIVDSTFSQNVAASLGGGILFHSDGTLFVGSSTIAYNHLQGNAAANSQGAGIRLDGGSATIVNSIIANNDDLNPADPPDCGRSSGTLVSDHDLVRAPAASCVFAGVGDQTGVDPLLARGLADNGGPTPTIAIVPDSPAHDAADPAGCTDALGVTLAYDQRGAPFARGYQGGPCDKGAFEIGDQIFREGFE